MTRHINYSAFFSTKTYSDYCRYNNNSAINNHNNPLNSFTIIRNDVLKSNYVRSESHTIGAIPNRCDLINITICYLYIHRRDCIETR